MQLRLRTLLLVLDNAEHLPALPMLVDELLNGARHITILCTSREPLQLQGEHRFPLEGLQFDVTTGIDTDALRLFRDRAGNVFALLPLELQEELVSDLSGEAAEIDRLRARIESLEASNRALEEFAAAAAHDLEAPRRAIDRALGSADLAGAAAASTRLHGMLADLMEHARAGAAGGTPEDIDLSSFARETLAATAGGERFRLLCAGDTLVLRAPRVPLEIALRNLLANAVRHHDLATGTITLGLESDDKIWRLSVTDDGPGIPESERERIFEPFRRLSATPGGTGLGLSLVATAARRLGGAAEILNTRTSRGTTVLLTWPRQVG